MVARLLMACFKLTPLALQDLLGIRDYIAADNPAIAVRYLDILRGKCQMLADAPGLGVSREAYCGLFKFPVGRYLIFYRPSADGIEIVRMLHSARDVDTVLPDQPNDRIK